MSTSYPFTILADVSAASLVTGDDVVKLRPTVKDREYKWSANGINVEDNNNNTTESRWEVKCNDSSKKIKSSNLLN